MDILHSRLFNINMAKLCTDRELLMFMKPEAHPAKLIRMIIKTKTPPKLNEN